MNFDYPEETRLLIAKLEQFMDEHIYPAEQEYFDWVKNPANLWKYWPGLDE